MCCVSSSIDGRKIVPSESSEEGDNIIHMHPDFRMIVLANRNANQHLTFFTQYPVLTVFFAEFRIRIPYGAAFVWLFWMDPDPDPVAVKVTPAVFLYFGS